jgi:hypothetical protein
MGLFARFDIFRTPRLMMVELIGNDRLPALVDVDVAHGLFFRTVQFGQGFDGCPPCSPPARNAAPE